MSTRAVCSLCHASSRKKYITYILEKAGNTNICTLSMSIKCMSFFTSSSSLDRNVEIIFSKGTFVLLCVDEGKSVRKFYSLRSLNLSVKVRANVDNKKEATDQYSVFGSI